MLAQTLFFHAFSKHVSQILFSPFYLGTINPMVSDKMTFEIGNRIGKTVLGPTSSTGPNSIFSVDPSFFQPFQPQHQIKKVYRHLCYNWELPAVIACVGGLRICVASLISGGVPPPTILPNGHLYYHQKNRRIFEL